MVSIVLYDGAKCTLLHKTLFRVIIFFDVLTSNCSNEAKTSSDLRVLKNKKLPLGKSLHTYLSYDMQ